MHSLESKDDKQALEPMKPDILLEGKITKFCFIDFWPCHVLTVIEKGSCAWNGQR